MAVVIAKNNNQNVFNNSNDQRNYLIVLFIFSAFGTFKLIVNLSELFFFSLSVLISIRAVVTLEPFWNWHNLNEKEKTKKKEKKMPVIN